EALELRKEADYNQFQLDELSAVRLVAGEQGALEEQQRVLEHAEEIKAKITEALEQLHADQFGAMTSLGQVNLHLGQLSRFGQTFSDLKERFNSVLIELNDISATLEDENDKLEVDYDKLASVTDRLSRIYQLQQKHGVDTVEELIQIEADLADKAFQIGNLDEELAKLQQETEIQWQALLEAGALLSEK